MIRRGSHNNKRCFVVAGGPSLKQMDLSRLKGEIVICVNESFKVLDFEPDYVCIGDYKLWDDVKEAYSKMSSKIIVGTGLKGTCGQGYSAKNLAAVYPLNSKEKISEHGFSWNIQKGLRVGYNVITEVVLPFVCWCGFSECYLLGCDCSDDGHAYQSARAEFQRFDPRAMKAYETIASTPNLPTKIYNATPGGNLNCFPRRKFETLRELLVIGFYTKDKNYPQLAKRMQLSVRAQGLPCEIREMKSLADEDLPKPLPWVLNCSLCGKFILSMMDEFPGKDLLYLDADAVMIRRPSLFIDAERDLDFAAPFVTNRYITNQLSSNTLFFAATTNSRKVCELWVEEQEKRNQACLKKIFKAPYKEAWDQKVLQDVFLRVPNLRWAKLPLEYAKITVTPKGEELLPNVDKNKIVIEQYQASRENKMGV